MYGSFQSLIKTEAAAPIPPQMMDYFNSSIPKGFEYSKEEPLDDMCQLAAKEGRELGISGFTPRLSDRQTEMLEGEPITQRTVFKLLDNALESIELDGNNATLQLGEKTLPFGYLIRKVDDNEYATKGKFIATRTPLEFKMPLACGETKINIPFKQEPSGSINIKKFTSKNTALNITMALNEKDSTVKYQYNFDNGNEPNAQRCLEAAIVLDGIRNGETVVEGFGAINPYPETHIKTRLATFWQHVVDVEKALGTHFDSSAETDKRTIVNIERMYQCICEGKAVGLGYKPTSLTLTADTVPKTEGRPCRLLFPRHQDLIVFGKSITVFSDIGLSGIVLGEAAKIDEAKYEIPLTYIDDFQCSILYFASTPEKNDHSDDNVNRISEILFAPLPDGRRY